LLLFRADDLFPFNAKAPRWLNPLRSMMAVRRVIDAAFAVRLGWVWGHRLDVLISAVPKGAIVFTVTASRAA
jgi:hypothetical protein